MADFPVTTRTLRTVIAEDDRDIQQMLQITLELGGFKVVGQTYDGRETLDLVRELQPDILVLDLHMPEMGGLEVLSDINELAPACKVVIHSAIGAMFITDAALQAGAVAYIEKGVPPRSIVAHLKRVANAGGMRPPVRPYPLHRASIPKADLD